MINYLREQTKFNFGGRRACTKWIKSVILEESFECPKSVGDISIVFCSDKYLLQINRQFLSHDYFTDVITFDNSEDNVISGDIFISVDSVRSNAELYKQDFMNELHRVIIHGILHMLGYKDRTKEQKKVMREREDFYLNKKLSS
ncbi:MAG: rRNA maturation RNase YbeY [Rikenellaceae bacterium]